jgi:tRNA(Ile)-lysidine synthase
MDPTNLIDRVENNLQSRQLAKPNEKMLVAVSGGLDSAVLLHLLHQLSHRHGWRLVAAHFNHQLRGKQSHLDQRLAEDSAKALRLSIVVGSANVKAFAVKNKVSIEMAARRLRHEFLARTARRRRIRCVALAHHADDQVELLFLRLLRGAGGEGLGGMKWLAPSPANPKVQLIRPLLDVSRSDLEQFARMERIPFREDETNRQLDFERNRIRHELLPHFRKHARGEMDKALLRSMKIISDESDFVGEAARAWLARKTTAGFAQLHLAVQRRVLHAQLLDRGLVPDFALIEHLRTSGHAPISIAHGRTVWRDTEGFIHEKRRAENAFATREISMALKGRSGSCSFDRCKISWRIRKHSGRVSIPRRAKPGREYFDAEKVGDRALLRHWWPGDRFQPIGLGRPIKLQDWFVNQKMPRPWRHELVLAATETGEIFWVEGLRIAENFKLNPETKLVLEWRWTRPTRRTVG